MFKNDFRKVTLLGDDRKRTINSKENHMQHPNLEIINCLIFTFCKLTQSKRMGSTNFDQYRHRYLLSLEWFQRKKIQLNLKLWIFHFFFNLNSHIIMTEIEIKAKMRAAIEESGCSISSQILHWKWPVGINSSSGFWYPSLSQKFAITSASNCKKCDNECKKVIQPHKILIHVRKC